MEQIPAQSRVTLDSLLRNIEGTRTRFISIKDAGTLRYRETHFIKFIKDMKLGNNVALQSFTPLIRNVIIAYYTTHLASGRFSCVALSSH